jgi:hypothetical protein
LMGILLMGILRGVSCSVGMDRSCGLCQVVPETLLVPASPGRKNAPNGEYVKT